MDNSKTPAYPVRRFDEDGHPFLDKRDSGMTKLEAFAMAAMQGLCGSVAETIRHGGLSFVEAGTIATTAILVAQATLSELEKQ